MLRTFQLLANALQALSPIFVQDLSLFCLIWFDGLCIKSLWLLAFLIGGLPNDCGAIGDDFDLWLMKERW